jgi:transposase
MKNSSSCLPADADYLPADAELLDHPLTKGGWTLGLVTDSPELRIYDACPPPFQAEKCMACGEKGVWVFDRRPMKTAAYRDIPPEGKRRRTKLKIEQRRLECSKCGEVVQEVLLELDKDLQVTTRLRERIKADLHRFETFSHIARSYGLSVNEVKRIDRGMIAKEDARRIEEKKLCLPANVGFHRAIIAKTSCSLLTNVVGRNVWELVVSDQEQELVDKISQLFNDSQFKNVRTVSMPIVEEYRAVARQQFPRAKILVPRYYLEVMVNQLLENIATVEARSLGQNKDARDDALKVLCTRHGKLSKRAKGLLQKVLPLNERVKVAYEAKEAFLKILRCDLAASARSAFGTWRENLPARCRSDFESFLSAIHQWDEEVFDAFEYSDSTEYLKSLDQIILLLKVKGRGYSPQTIRGRLLYMDPLKVKAELYTAGTSERHLSFNLEAQEPLTPPEFFEDLGSSMEKIIAFLEDLP